MSQLVLPTVRVGFINVNWTNGSNRKPINPIPREIVEQFHLKEDYKINWLSNETGLITLEGNYNYLVFNETEYYFLEKTRIIDIDKLIYVYTLTKDHWQHFLNNSDSFVRGYLIKTNIHEVLWSNIQKTKSAISDVNAEKVLKVCKTECETGLGVNLKLTGFRRENNVIKQFPDFWRFYQEDLNNLVSKLSLNTYDLSQLESNQVFGCCDLDIQSNWRNYIADLIEEFFTDDVLKITLASEKNLNTVLPNLKNIITDVDDADKVIYYITKSAESGTHKADKTNLQGDKVKDRLIREIDLSQITDIELVDLTEPTKIANAFNVSIYDFNEGHLNKEVKIDNTTWYLKPKLYGNNINYETYKHLGIPNGIFQKFYSLNNDLINKSNLKSIDSHYIDQNNNILFSNSYVPAFYFPSWKYSITDQNILNLTKNQNTELGYLLNNISNYENTIIQDIQNKHVYAGDNIYITTGIQLDNLIKCDKVFRLADDVEIELDVKVSFSEVYKKEIEKSLWLTIWDVYLWWGQLGRTFVGLSQKELESEIKMTLSECWVDDKLEIWTSERLSKTKDDTYINKIPTWGEFIGRNDSMDDFKKIIQAITKRRQKIEIKNKVEVDIKEGDIYWSNLAYGLFPKINDEFIKEHELKIDKPKLVVYWESGYTTKLKQIDYENSGGFKFGILENHEVTISEVDKNNLINTAENVTNIYSIKSAFKELTTTEKIVSYNRDLFRDKFLNVLRKIRSESTWLQNPGETKWEGEWLANYSMENWPKNDDGTYALIKYASFDWERYWYDSSSHHGMLPN